ncbi:hypothetical protein OIU74_016525 [Salix koriyanagi]|uniref:Uncharacterized protein n=1 Tax=Salix koriyanagi TaxID=2511006 RepID=A0A9Q0PGL4_9ROSI|nr:hypothetical protein OIU74_016525 [Salix koriyanagi]
MNVEPYETLSWPSTAFLKSLQVEEEEEEESVLDGLVKTVLSQNTTEVNSQRAFLNLKSAFPTWENVLAAESKFVENAISVAV